MRRGMVLATLLLLWPVAVRAQNAEALLPSKSHIYFRWDGLAAHRGDFDKTAIGKTLKGDTGKFFDELLKFAGEHIENGLNQADPNAVGIYKDITRIMRGLIQDGVVVGIEGEKVNPPRVQGVIVFPKAADETGTLLPLIQKAADAGRAEVKDTKVGRRFLHRLEVDNVPGLHVAWWKEGEDAVVTIGTIDPVDYVKAVDAKTTGIAKHPLYKQLQGFKEFKTSSRGFIDVKGISGTVSTISPEVAKLVDELGVKGVKSVVFVGGYDGPAQRAVVEVDIPGPRNGLLSMISSKKFGLKDLPAMPNDITGFSAGSIELSKAYDSITQVATGAIKIFAPDQADNITGTVKAFEAVLGVKFSEDIFANFGDMVVNYSTPSESIFGFSGTTLIKVKDGKKLMAGIDTLVKNIPQQPGFEIIMKKKKYKDGEMAEVYLKTDANTALLGCIGLHKDWFIYSQYPTGIKGYILRANGELPTWKANEELTKILADFPKEFTGITVSDPRPTIEFLLAATPFVVNLANTLTSQFLPGSRPFDLDLIPHAQDATRHLFPNVTISTDDGKKLRSVTRNSFP